MKIIRIGFSRSRGKYAPIGWLIRKILRTKYSHVYIRIDNRSLFDIDTVYHSSGKSGVSYYAEPVFHKYSKTVTEFAVPLKKHIYHKLRKDCHQSLGLKYAFMQNLGILLKMVGLATKNPWKQGMNCSEAVYKALCLADSSLIGKYDPDLVTPKDIEEILVKSGYQQLQINQ